MKLALYVHHLNNFHLLKTEGVNQRAAEGASFGCTQNGLFQKKSKQASGGVWGHEISRGSEKTEWENSRDQLKRSGNSGGDQEKIMWNFHGSWFLALEFPSGVSKSCEIFRFEALFCQEFPRIKLETKNSTGFFKKYVLNPSVCVFGMTQCQEFIKILTLISLKNSL